LNEPSSAKRRAKENTRAAVPSPVAQTTAPGINAFLEDNGVTLADMHQVTELARSALPLYSPHNSGLIISQYIGPVAGPGKIPRIYHLLSLTP
jgi:hypothetical protein